MSEDTVVALDTRRTSSDVERCTARRHRAWREYLEREIEAEIEREHEAPPVPCARPGCTGMVPPDAPALGALCWRCNTEADRWGSP